jgi:glycosyltransferase involved in cell wall biosynthesis
MIREQEQRYKEVLNQIIVKMKLTTIVYFVEDPNTLEDFYHIADCTVSLSRLEFFPLTMLESIGCQTPYFGFPNGINKMLLPPIDTRLLIKTKAPQIISSQISTFFLSNIKRREIAERGLQVVKDYTWEHTALKLYALCSKEIYHI